MKRIFESRWPAVYPTDHLIPLNQLTPAPQESDHDWLSCGDDPQFLISKRLPLPGWQMLEVAIDHDQPGLSVRIYFDTGSGFSEKESIYLPLKSGRITKRLFFAPAALRALRLDPMESPGQFSIRHLRIIWLMPWFAYDRLSQRLVNMHYRWRHHSKEDVIAAIKADARRINRHWRDVALSHYEETFEHYTVSRYYKKWLEVQSPLGKTAVQGLLEKHPYQPLLSILMPVYEPSLKWLKESLNAVVAQSYPHWELIITIDASAKAEVKTLLSEYAECESRIQLILRTRRESIYTAYNSALGQACGEYVAILGSDDCLAQNALFHVIDYLQRYPHAEVLYSDEDKLNSKGERQDPHFKPQWNPDLLLSQYYFSQLSVYRTSLVREVGAFREGFEGSETHDLALRCTANVSPEQIVHIPHILYHRRSSDVFNTLFNQQGNHAPGLHAVREYLLQHAPGADVELGLLPNTYRIRWPLPTPAPLVSLLVPTRDRVDILRPCVEAVLNRTDYPNLELLILDNMSRCPETLAFMNEVSKQDSRVRVIRWDHPFNYSAINNYGASQAKGDILGLLNNDVEPINPDWLWEMVSHACRPEIGCVGAKLYYPNGTIQHGGVILGLGGVAGHAHRFFGRDDDGYYGRLKVTHALSAVTAACLLLRKPVFEDVGGLNEINLPIAFNDVDLCLKVREAGYRNIWTPYAELYHHESVSRGPDNNSSKRARAAAEVEYMRRRWGDLLDADPAYNPNLTFVYEDFSLR